jgi:hypothetical protein
MMEEKRRDKVQAMIAELEEIADFIAGRIDGLMPQLKLEMEGSPSWDMVVSAGLFFHHFRSARMDGLNGEDAKGFAIAKLMQNNMVSNLLAKMAANKLDVVTGVQ